MWNRLGAIIAREYIERVRTKAFWISTALVPLLFAALMFVPIWLTSRGAGDYTIALLDRSGFGDAVTARLDELVAEREAMTLELERVAPEADVAAQRETLKERAGGDGLDGALILPEGLAEGATPEYLSPNVTALRLNSLLERAIDDVVVEHRLTGAGLDPERVDELTRSADLQFLKLGPGGDETADEGQSFFLSYMFTYILLMSVLMYGIYVMRGVLEEKSSRIVEVIIGAVRPIELMLGKIIGIGAVGMTQMALWAALAVVLATPAAAGAIGLAGDAVPDVPVSLMVFFVLFFVLGFLLYGAIYAGVGAAFDTEQEAQQFQTVLSMVLIAPLLLMFLIMNQPDSSASVVLSLIPLFTPMLMFLRMTLTQVPAWQVLLSVALMGFSIVAMAWLVGRVYRVGILMHGSKPKLRDLGRWLRG